jgi:hypothetical protein
MTGRAAALKGRSSDVSFCNLDLNEKQSKEEGDSRDHSHPARMNSRRRARTGSASSWRVRPCELHHQRLPRRMVKPLPVLRVIERLGHVSAVVRRRGESGVAGWVVGNTGWQVGQIGTGRGGFLVDGRDSDYQTRGKG